MDAARENSQKFGQLAIQLGFLSHEQLEGCLKLQEFQKKRASCDRLGQIMKAKNYLTEIQIQQVLELQERNAKAKEEVEEAVEEIVEIESGSFDAFQNTFENNPLLYSEHGASIEMEPQNEQTHDDILQAEIGRAHV